VFDARPAGPGLSVLLSFVSKFAALRRMAALRRSFQPNGAKQASLGNALGKFRFGLKPCQAQQRTKVVTPFQAGLW